VSGSLFSWDLTNSKQIHSFQGHNSAVTGFEVRNTAFKSHAFSKYYERGQVTRRKEDPFFTVRSSAEIFFKLKTDISVFLHPYKGSSGYRRSP
jgi:hypothetical protein